MTLVNFANIADVAIKISNQITAEYGSGYTVEVGYSDVFRIYIANIIDSSHKDIRGRLYDSSLYEIPTPQLEKIDDTGRVLMGKVNNKFYPLVKKVVNNQVEYVVDVNLCP